MAPLPYESTASWLGRVAATYRQSVPELLDGIGITTTGARGADDTDTTEIHLDDAARHRLAVFARVPHHHLARALPHLERPRDANPARTPDAVGATGGQRRVVSPRPVRTTPSWRARGAPAPHRRRHRTRTDVPACPSGVVLAAFVLEHPWAPTAAPGHPRPARTRPHTGNTAGSCAGRTRTPPTRGHRPSSPAGTTTGCISPAGGRREGAAWPPSTPTTRPRKAVPGNSPPGP
ncbi:hypothetical protein [Embleya sp. NBC_00896]|uniref:hypothetical protein n=1 Tax=Embleya sp. NBC_00896 TaxID=2975961 RepID=UPI00386978C8